MDFKRILDLVYFNGGHIAVACLSITVLLCLFNYKNLNQSFKYLFYFLIWNLFIEISARIVAFSGFNNLPLLHLYTLGEFFFLSLFYKSLLSKPLFFQKRYWYIITIGALLIILNSVFFQSIYGFNPLAKTMVQIIIIGYAVLYFYNLTETSGLSLRVEKSLRLINSAILIYYSGSLFIFMCNQLFLVNSESYEVIWAFNAILNLIFQLLILLAIWKVVSRKTPLSS